jgi:hypothetical protein
MAFYTVLTPPPDCASGADTLEQAVFLKDGFVISAFIFTGLWLLSKRLWLWFALFVAVWLAIGFGGRMIGVNPLALAAAQTLIGLFLGLEGNALLERKLIRQGWTLAGVVEGAKLDTVERRFFEAAAQGQAFQANTGERPASGAIAAALARLQGRGAPAVAAGPVVGLFPDPPASAR